MRKFLAELTVETTHEESGNSQKENEKLKTYKKESGPWGLDIVLIIRRTLHHAELAAQGTFNT